MNFPLYRCGLLRSFSLGLLGLRILCTETGETLGQTAAANTLCIAGLWAFEKLKLL